MKKLTLAIFLLIALLALPMFAAIPKAFAPLTDVNVLSADRIGEPMDIDPSWAYDTSSAELLMNVYDPLLWFNYTETGTFYPKLATSWEYKAISETSPEGLPWVSRLYFTLRTGVHFQDTSPPSGIPGAGDLLLSTDVEHTFERLLIISAGTGPSWMCWEPLTSVSSMGALNTTLYAINPVLNPINPTTHWNTHIDEAIDHAVQSNGTHVWFNLAMPYQPFLQILAQNWGGIVSQKWCSQFHHDWPGPSAGDNWYQWFEPETSALYDTDPQAPGPHLDCALGTGPYILDYWNKGAGNSWSIIKNDPLTPGIGSTYWEGWATPYAHPGWGGGLIQGHVNRYTSNYIPEWSTRRLRFLGGVSDFCDVPRNYMNQVLGQAGIRCIFPLPQMTCDAMFFNFLVTSTSTYLGVMQSNSTFNEFGAPPNMMSDLNMRLGMAHMFDYTTFLYAAFLNESISPVTPMVPGISYYDPSIGQLESPSAHTQKKYGISTEAAGQMAYDMALAKTYLQAAWGGTLWATGFTFTAVYNEGNVARQISATLMKDAFEEINAEEGTKFHLNVVSVPWNGYSVRWRGRQLPFFVVGWLADYPDAHNFAFPFMHSAGDFSKYQGFKGITTFPNQVVDDHIAAGIGSVVPSVRQAEYTWLAHYYVDNAPGFCTAQATGRHFERDWVVGWYYNPIYPGNFVYDLSKAILVTPVGVDVAVTTLDCPTEIHVTDLAVNGTIIIVPSPISVTVTRLDTTGPASIVVLIGVGLQDESGRDIVLGSDTATLTNTGSDSYTTYFYSFTQDAGAPIYAGKYKVFAEVLVSSGFATDTNAANNRIDQAPIFINDGDVNLDNTCDMADISLMIDTFMTTPFMPLWDVRCDTNRDRSIDMADISTGIDNFMNVYPFP